MAPYSFRILKRMGTPQPIPSSNEIGGTTGASTGIVDTDECKPLQGIAGGLIFYLGSTVDLAPGRTPRRPPNANDACRCRLPRSTLPNDSKWGRVQFRGNHSLHGSPP